MSYLYRPTPVFNPGPQAANLSGAVSGGVMRGCDSGVNWKAYFDSSRAATQGKPWIVSSGAMGAFLAQDSIDISSLPLTPYDPGISLAPLPLPDSFWSMPSPIAPAIVPYDPGSVPAIVSSGRSILQPPGALPVPGFSWASLIAPLASLGTQITRSVTGSGGGINPATAPLAPAGPAALPAQQSSLIAQAQSLQAQANALQTSNPTLAAQYRASASALLAQAGASSSGSWFTQSTIFSGLPNWGVLAGGAAVIAIAFSFAGRRGK